MKTKSDRRFVEALYDLESGKTYVRHPAKEEWIECGLLADVVKGRPVASVTSEESCAVFSSAPQGNKRGESKKSTLMLTVKGEHSELN